MQTTKSKLIKPSILLADKWEDHFDYQNFINLKYWDYGNFTKIRKSIIIPEYIASLLTRFDESKMFLGSYLELTRSLMYVGLLAIAKCNNVSVKMANSLLKSRGIDKHYAKNIYIEEVMNKIDLKNQAMVDLVKNMYKLYGLNDVIKKYYRYYFNEEINVKVIDDDTKKVMELCYIITESEPNIHCFKLDKNKENKHIWIWLHEEFLLLAEDVKELHQGSVISEILRASLLQGLYMVSKWILNKDYDNTEGYLTKLVRGIKKCIVEHNKDE